MNRPYDFRISTLDSRLLNQPVEKSFEADGIDAVGLGSNKNIVADENGWRAVEIGAANLLHLVLHNGGRGWVINASLERRHIISE